MKILTCLPILFLFPLIGAHAATAVEDRIFNARMPHEALSGARPTIKVHYVRLEGYMGTQAAQDAAVAELRQQVASCSADHLQRGLPNKPPAAFPTYQHSMREDVYLAANRSISYSQGVFYALNSQDCSLIEVSSYNAHLVSAKGGCTIDLKKKLAKGVCGNKAHADAPLALSAAITDPREAAAFEKMRNGPQAAVLAAAMKRRAQLQRGTGVMKTIRGLQCEIWNHQPALGGTFCIATGGSFSAGPVPQTGQLGLILESTSSNAYTMHAVAAGLDADISPEVFAPYLLSGFPIEKQGK